MARIKGGLNAKKKHNRVLKLAKSYRGARSKQYRVAKQSVMRALTSSFAGRKERKRQFFIMHKDAPHLDGQYAAFGKVTDGMDTVNAIAETETDYSDAPLEPQMIIKVTVDTDGVDYPEPEKC